MTFYKIGEVARLLGLTTQALRFYEQEGVVTPKKSENGTRYYDEDQLILLLSFKKYRQADFSVQDIVTHFKDDHLSGLREQILAQREALLKQSELLRRRAYALDAFEKRLAYAQAHLDEPAICDRPPLRLLRPSLSELSAADVLWMLLSPPCRIRASALPARLRRRAKSTSACARMKRPVRRGLCRWNIRRACRRRGACG